MSEPMTAAQLVEMVTSRPVTPAPSALACCSPNRGASISRWTGGRTFCNVRRTRPMKGGSNAIPDAQQTDQDGLLSELHAMPDFPGSLLHDGLTVGSSDARTNDAFSPVEHCWHLADLEREGYEVRIRRLLEEASPRYPTSTALESRESGTTSRSRFAEGLEAFRVARLRNIALLRTLDAGDWMRRGEQEGVG